MLGKISAWGKLSEGCCGGSLDWVELPAQKVSITTQYFYFPGCQLENQSACVTCSKIVFLWQFLRLKVSK